MYVLKNVMPGVGVGWEGKDQLPHRSVILQLQGDSLQWEVGHNDLKELILM